MYNWLESEVQAMARSDYLITLAVLAGICGYLIYYCYGAFRRYRFVDGTATSKIRSAAQGYVELKGLGEWLPQDSITSPFSNSRCLWYHCTIDKRERTGKRSTWTNISDDCSEHLFRLVDDTGSCIIDPDHAHVIPESDITWYGNSISSRTEVPSKPGWMRLSMGSHRFRERLIRPATTLYALGWFRTLHSNPSDEYIARQVEDLVKQWKLQPHRYLAEYDLDQNGKIQRDEWRVIRSAARKQILKRLNDEIKEHHVLARPRDSNQPYILSATPEEELVVSKKRRAYVSITGAFLIFAVLVLMSSIRPPFAG